MQQQLIEGFDESAPEFVDIVVCYLLAGCRAGWRRCFQLVLQKGYSFIDITTTNETYLVQLDLYSLRRLEEHRQGAATPED